MSRGMMRSLRRLIPGCSKRRSCIGVRSGGLRLSRSGSCECLCFFVGF